MLKPAYSKDNNYRVYTEKEYILLKQILFFKELGFSLTQIKDIVSNPKYPIEEALKDQRHLLEIQKQQIEQTITYITNTIKNMKGGTTMQTQQDEQTMEAYKEEIKQKWGDKYLKQSEERTKSWTKEDYTNVEQQGKDITKKIAEIMHKGIEDPEVQERINEFYMYIRQFYDCTLDIFVQLGEMYVSDERFRKYYEVYDTLLPEFMRDAIAYFAKHQ